MRRWACRSWRINRAPSAGLTGWRGRHWVGVMAVVLVPASFNELPLSWITQIRADFVANLVREGAIHGDRPGGYLLVFRERSGEAFDGDLSLQDRRDERRTLVYIAEIGHDRSGGRGELSRGTRAA